MIRLGANWISPALSCPGCIDTAGYRRPTPDGGNYYYYLLVLLILQILLLLLRLLLLLLLQRPNEFHTELKHSTWYTVCPNNPILHLQLRNVVKHSVPTSPIYPPPRVLSDTYSWMVFNHSCTASQTTLLASQMSHGHNI